MMIDNNTIEQARNADIIEEEDNGICGQINIFELILNGCKITLNFLPESDGEAIDSVKKILSSPQHKNNLKKAEETG